MKSQILNILLATIVCGALVAAAHTLPPLTQPGSPINFKNGHDSAANFDPTEYCQNSMSGVNCACFAQKAAQVLAQDRERVSGFAYADQVDLAVAQGEDSCS